MEAILVIAICAIIGGADDWSAVKVWGKAKRKGLEKFLDLPNGIPSQDTFGRVLARLDPKQFQRCFLSWTRAVARRTHRQIVAVDEKKVRCSYDRTRGKGALAMVSAWATANRLVLGQRQVKDESNEITAIPQPLCLLGLAGGIVTIDAIGCQTKIVETIVQPQGDYLIAVKENRGQLYHDVQDLFAGYRAVNFRDVPHDYHKTVKDLGRIEIRECWTLSDPELLDYLRQRGIWKNLQSGDTLLHLQSGERCQVSPARRARTLGH